MDAFTPFVYKSKSKSKVKVFFSFVTLGKKPHFCKIYLVDKFCAEVRSFVSTSLSDWDNDCSVSDCHYDSGHAAAHQI